MPAVRGYAYRDHAGVELSPLYNRDEPTYASYWQNRDPRMAMTILEPGSEWVGGNDGTPGDNVTATPVFQLPRFASLKNNNSKHGRACVRERMWQTVEISVVAGTIKKKK